MVSTSDCAKADEVDLVGRLSPVIGVGDKEDIVEELVEWPRLKGSRVECPMGCSRFREFCKAKSSVDGIWGHAFGYRGNFFRTCSIRQGGDYLYLLPNLAKEKKYIRLGDEVSLEYVQGMVKESRTDGFCCYLAQFDYGLKLPLGKLAKEYYEYDWGLPGISYKVSRKESFIDSIAKEGIELEVVLKRLGINRFKRVASKDDKLARLNKMPDGPVDMATISDIIVRNLTMRKTVKKGDASHSAMSDSVDDNSKRRKVTPPAKSQVVLEENVKMAEGADLRLRFEFVRALRGAQLGLQDRETAALKLKEVRAESVAEAERLVSTSATSRNNLAGKLYQLRYTKAEILAFSVGNYEEKKIMDEEEVEEMEDDLNVVKKTVADNQETIDREIKSLRLRVVDLEGLLEVEKNSSADLMFVYVHSVLRPKLVSWSVGQGGTGSPELAGKCSGSLSKELDVARERGEHTLLYIAEYAEEYVALISQYENRLDDNVKLSLKLEEAKSQVENKTATLLSKDLALNQLISKLAELKERAASGSRHVAELDKYRIRALNEKISYMKCNIRALNEQLLKREIDLDTVRTNLAVSEANFEKLSSNIVGKDLKLRNSAQIRDSLIARLDRLKADLRHLKEREAQSRADLAKVQAKNKSLVDDLAHVHGNVRRVVQCDKEMNERIYQLCAQITELERELRAREMNYKKDLKLELDKRDSKIASGDGS
ncbi:hypothetical protein GIB67_031173 [Kingdonia uniflora]|uniref:Uncharacterized protein n=1 Tax=Kingdonia uniflora TaxID=39325 RepID=A0A7J7NKP4_9MAGN|nr:hypothetical protein GIB67_031173 [Kingdonia uniflora]